ncbi:transcription initiation protein [Modestobacter sp. I12A-02628]|uniref:Transcription initiation protein n=1 Tax=Goekera deserti TaxID=2497753 RepID=A0A7K3WCI4_9ACTN|nr:YciI family protein [Goekera deserti]MPQ98508.1 transcription initiation protein [Goekera deserti]NDI48338.1 transcription initiation protein [Goekera deserti]NEL54087.1 transcription initiation protein [Goekera deserti]
MPTYAAILYSSRDADWTAPEEGPVMAEYGAFSQVAGPAVTGGAALFPTSTATTVRVQGGKGGDVLTTDGPFAEAKEVLSGFFLLDAPDLDAAIALAAQIPAAWDGAVELRPVIPMAG